MRKLDRLSSIPTENGGAACNPTGFMFSIKLLGANTKGAGGVELMAENRGIGLNKLLRELIDAGATEGGRTD